MEAVAPARARPPDEATSLRFAAGVRALASSARAGGLVVPAYRSPPRLGGVDRSLRRRVDGGATVSVRLRGRPWPAVLADMIDGLVVANGLEGVEAAGARASAWSAIEASGLVDAVPSAVAQGDRVSRSGRSRLHGRSSEPRPAAPVARGEAA